MKKIISSIVLYIGIICIYINIASIMEDKEATTIVDNGNTKKSEKNISEEEYMIEDEPIPGGAVVEGEESNENKGIEFYLCALVLTGIGIKIISKNNT